MRIAALVAAALAAALFAPQPADARDQKNRREAVSVEPGRAYILYRSPERLIVNFVREVDDAERAAWEAARQTAFEREIQRHDRRFAAWVRDRRTCNQNPRSPCVVGPRPVRPTLETFGFAPPEADNFIDVNAGPQFERGDGEFTYLMAVEPGSYVIYGSIAATQNGALGVCLCMGSLRFEARAGEITDVGLIRFPATEAQRAVRRGAPAPNARPHFAAVVPADPSMSMSPRLAGLPVRPAELRSADKLPNYFGVLIDRMEPLAGVLAYDRDRIVDLKARATAASPAAAEPAAEPES